MISRLSISTFDTLRKIRLMYTTCFWWCDALVIIKKLLKIYIQEDELHVRIIFIPVGGKGGKRHNAGFLQIQLASCFF